MARFVPRRQEHAPPARSSPEKDSADDFDRLAWLYDWIPVPTHPPRLAPRLRGIHGPVLDLGGGTGRFSARMFDPDKARILVADPAAKMLAKTRRKGRRVEGIRCIGEALPLGDASLAAVVITEAFHHFAHGQQDILRETARVLRQDGLLLIEEPDPSRFMGRLMRWGERRQGMNSVFRSPPELVRMLEPHFGSITTARTGWFTYLVEGRDPIG